MILVLYLDLLQVDLLASGASLFCPRSGRPRATKSREVRRRTFLKVYVVSDLKTDRMPCFCRQWRSGLDNPLRYGGTAVDLISVVGSLLDIGWFLDFVMLTTKEQGYSLETRTEDKCFFSSEITDGLVIIFFDRSYKHLTTPCLTDWGWCESQDRYWSVCVVFL